MNELTNYARKSDFEEKTKELFEITSDHNSRLSNHNGKLETIDQELIKVCFLNINHYLALE